MLIWTADYVAGYGTGAIGCAARHADLEFAEKFKLPVEVVVQAPEGEESLHTGGGACR